MKPTLNPLIIGMFIALTACSSQQTRQDTPALQAASPPSPSPQENLSFSGQNPAMTIKKAGKTLNLVRIMDGAACKNDLEGAKGSFLIYASPGDIERIKREQGAKIFSDFEQKIQAFSEAVLQEAVNSTYLAEDPFALGKDEAREKLAEQLSARFNQVATTPIADFEKETTLTIDIVAYSPSLSFYQQGCEAVLDESPLPEMNSTNP